jgi:cytochrome c-type biogenesis protein
MSAALAFAFGAGLVSPLNPCGFGLLPAFFGYRLGTEEHTHTAPMATRLWRGLIAGGAVSAGFAGVLMSAGLLVTLGLRPLVRFVPAAAVLIGLVLIATGVAMLLGKRLPLGRLAGLRPSADDSRSRLLVFGAGYAVASIACTIAVLLAVVGQALAAGNTLGTLAVLGAYGAGAATLLTGLTVWTALAGATLSARPLRRLLPLIEPLASVLLILSGAYLAATNLPGLRDTDLVQAVSAATSSASSGASTLVGSTYLWFVPAAAALVVLAAVLFFWRRRATRRTTIANSTEAVPPPPPAMADCCGPDTDHSSTSRDQEEPV